jgi:hypothetical protein
MKWSSTGNEKHTMPRFELLNGSEHEMTLRYNPVQHSGRLERNHHHLLFFLEQTGIRGNKFLFENEYGVEIGRIVFDHAQHPGGSIQIDRNKIAFKIEWQADSGEISFIPNKFLRQPFRCGLPPDPNPAGRDKNPDSGEAERYACLILGLFWYLFPASIPEANKSEVFLSVNH